MLKSLAAKSSAKQSGSGLGATRARIENLFGKAIAANMSDGNLLMTKALTDGQLRSLAKQARQSSPTTATRPAPINHSARLAGRKIETWPGVPGVVVDGKMYPSLDAVPDAGANFLRKGANQSESDRNQAADKAARWAKVDAGKVPTGHMNFDELEAWNRRDRARRQLKELEGMPSNRWAQYLHYNGRISSEDGAAAMKYVADLNTKANVKLTG